MKIGIVGTGRIEGLISTYRIALDTAVSDTGMSGPEVRKALDL